VTTPRRQTDPRLRQAVEHEARRAGSPQRLRLREALQPEALRLLAEGPPGADNRSVAHELLAWLAMTWPTGLPDARTLFLALADAVYGALVELAARPGVGAPPGPAAPGGLADPLARTAPVPPLAATVADIGQFPSRFLRTATDVKQHPRQFLGQDRQLQRLLETLPAVYADLLLLRDFAGRTVNETARLLEMDEPSIEDRLTLVEEGVIQPKEVAEPAREASND
jgi:sigma-70-like protein